MRYSFLLWLSAGLLCLPALAFGQKLKSPTAGAPEAGKRSLQRTLGTDNELPFREELKPFYHGVASGDPLENSVIIWTRVTSDTDGPVEVKWFVYTEPELENMVAEGSTTAEPDADYTVKVDVAGLLPGTTYYYHFQAEGQNSLVGRTKTLPEGGVEHLRFAVVSCNNYEAGYFNAFGRIAERNDLDAVIHLGDYIYEYGKGTYGIGSEDRVNIPEDEILTLADYRTRYSLYRLDADLMNAHRQHPFISVWDDHESANDAHKDGAENHDEGEGSWEERKAVSKQVYSEWMPIRGEADQIYRKLSYGNLVDLIMLDTRLEGRDEQINDVTDPLLYAEDRTLLGTDQFNWFLQQLSTSEAKWKVIGNQVIFAHMNVGFAAEDPTDPAQYAATESVFLDIWDGYPAERAKIIGYMMQNAIDNVVWLTGDFHCGFGFDVAMQPADDPITGATSTYNGDTGEGSVAVEFATPSITSANFDENVDAATSAQLELCINSAVCTGGTFNPNPHMKFVELDRHGYFILDLKEESAQANWYFVESILEPDGNESFEEAWFSLDGQNRLQQADAESEAKANAPALAPDEIPEVQDEEPPTALDENGSIEKGFTVLGLYPNPASELCYLNYAVSKPQKLKISVFDTKGSEIRTLTESIHRAGNFTLSLNFSDLPAGMYLLKILNEEQQIVRRVVIQ